MWLEELFRCWAGSLALIASARVRDMYAVSSTGVTDELWVVEPADETERSLPGVGIPVLGRPGVGIPDDRGFWFVDAYRDMTGFASWPTIGSCRSLHASSSTILRKAAHRRAASPHPVAVRHCETARRCSQDSPRNSRGDTPIRFLFLRREPRTTPLVTIPSGSSASPLAFTGDRIPTIATRSKTKARFSGTEEELVRSEDTCPSSG